MGTHRTRIRAINTELAQFDGQNGVTYLDIGPKFLDEHGQFLPGVAPDNLHLSEQGYRIWADAMEPTLVKLLGETK